MTEGGGKQNIMDVPRPGQFRDAAAALIVAPGGRFLMQLRDDKPRIFYPNHYGCFGGAMEEGEDGMTALRRELEEELDYRPERVEYFTEMSFDFEVIGGKRAIRLYYEMHITEHELETLTLGEGSGMACLTASEIILEHKVVPYDSFAIWLFGARRELLDNVT